MKHTVTRKWTRKDGTTVTRTYTYNKGKSHKGKTLVDAKGRINYKNVKAFKE
jgi:hypothetical protein